MTSCKEDEIMKKIFYVSTTAISIKAFFIPQLQFLSENGFDVTVICSPDNELQTLLGEGVRYVPIEIPRGVSLFGSLKAIRKLTKFFKKEKFDLVQYSTPNAAFYSAIASKRTKVKVRNYHLMGLRYLGEKGLKRKILRYLDYVACKKSTHIECVSPSNLQLALQENLFKKEKGVVVWNGSSGGIDLKRFDASNRESYRKEIREKFLISEEDLVFGFVGRITKDKGINEILSAFDKIENAKLLMVGPKEATQTLDKNLYEKSLSNKNIIYTGLVKDVEKYYSAIDVLLFPSYREGFGNVVMEAGAMGTPAIISNIPGPIDAIKIDKTALVVEPYDADGLYLAMEKLMDKELREQMSEQAVLLAKNNFDQEILMQRILERKRELVKE